MTSLRTALLALVFVAAACSDSSRVALGDANSVIVVAADSVWSEVEDTVLTTLQPQIFAVRDENTFNLTHVSPADEDWLELRRFRQVLAIGRESDVWVADALREAGAEPGAERPAILEADDVWARDQRVTILVLPEERPGAAVRSALDSLGSLLETRYRVWAMRRMFISGHDTALTDTLSRQGGFRLDMPHVYRWRQVGDSAFMFINDNPDASQLVRSLLVTWRAGTEGEPSPESLVAWRDSIADRFYDWVQVTDTSRMETRRLSEPGDGGLELRGIWDGTVDNFPQAGPFIAWIVDCPAQDRRYLLDAWLYAPARDKFQYMIQLETLLGSFECGR